MDETKKRKLTLSVDSAVVEKAKSLGLNISEITENALRGFSFEPKEVEQEGLYEKYAELFSVMLPMLKRYGTSIDIGERTYFDENDDPSFISSISLLTDGNFWFDAEETQTKNIRDIAVYEFHNPNKILANLIEAMSKASERNKQKLTELELAKRIVEAIGATLSKNEPSKRLTPGKNDKANVKAANESVE